MGDLVRCTSCNGRKRILGMGGMEKECLPCKGIGWTEAEKPIVTLNVTNSNGSPVKVKKKPGRKPNMQNRDILHAI